MIETELTPARIEQATETEFVDSHSCESNAAPGRVFVLRASDKSQYPDPAWVLVNVWLADEGDVRAGEAEIVGEILQVSVISIAYCPYCGALLAGNG